MSGGDPLSPAHNPLWFLEPGADTSLSGIRHAHELATRRTAPEPTRWPSERAKLDPVLPTIPELTAIIYNENASLSGDQLRDAAIQQAYVIMNRARMPNMPWGERPGTADKRITHEQRERIRSRPADNAAWQVAYEAAKAAHDGLVPDLTQGATAYGHREHDNAGVNPNVDRNPVLLQYGPFDDALHKYHYLDIYGADDHSNEVYIRPPYDSLDGPHARIPKMPNRK